MKNKLSTYDDHELVHLLKNDPKMSEAAFTEIYDRYSLRLNAYCRTILNNKEQAEDVFQETFIKFYQNVKADYKTGSIVGYLITIARNLCLNMKRDKKINVPIEDFDFPIDGNDNYEDKEMLELISFAIDLLEPQMKEVLVLRVYNDLPYEEIAEIIGITSARARYLVMNAKVKIKMILNPYIKDAINNSDRG